MAQFTVKVKLHLIVEPDESDYARLTAHRIEVSRTLTAMQRRLRLAGDANTPPFQGAFAEFEVTDLGKGDKIADLDEVLARADPLLAAYAHRRNELGLGDEDDDHFEGLQVSGGPQGVYYYEDQLAWCRTAWPLNRLDDQGTDLGPWVKHASIADLDLRVNVRLSLRHNM